MTNAAKALKLQSLDLTKRFGSFVALKAANITIEPGTVHALLGENGAGKSTLVKCIAGYHRAEGGSILLDGREVEISSPAAARALGIGMVYQHFTAVPGMTVAENLLLARAKLASVIDWPREHEVLKRFMERMPFSLPLNTRADDLAAGERQKLEILKQLFLEPKLLILDEPSSVLTPDEADEVLGLLAERAHAGETTIILITHKFREVLGYADNVTVLRQGEVKLNSSVQQTNQQQLAHAMMGESKEFTTPTRIGRTGTENILNVSNLCAINDRGKQACKDVNFSVQRGEILGIAGVAGNGQRELLQCIANQRTKTSGAVEVKGESFRATREQYQRLKVRSLPEEPLRNACVAGMSVAQNLSLRAFDRPPISRLGWMMGAKTSQLATNLIDSFKVKTRSPSSPIKDLSGGNVQRAVLARELSEPADLLLVSNPVFGLDFSAAGQIYERIMQMRNNGAAVLWLSEDLDELLGMADRIMVISDGQLLYETSAENADRKTIGSYMAGATH